MPRRDNSWNDGGAGGRRRDTPSTPAVAAATESPAGAGAAQQPRVRRRDESKPEPEPAEIATLARFRPAERRRQDPDTENVSEATRSFGRRELHESARERERESCYYVSRR